MVVAPVVQKCPWLECRNLHWELQNSCCYNYCSYYSVVAVAVVERTCPCIVVHTVFDLNIQMNLILIFYTMAIKIKIVLKRIRYLHSLLFRLHRFEMTV